MSIASVSKAVEAKTRRECARLVRRQKATSIDSAILLECLAQEMEIVDNQEVKL